MLVRDVFERVDKGLAVFLLGVATASGCARTPDAKPASDRVVERAASSPSQDHEATAARAVAVVELFTSEGCSSCPLADRVMSELAGEPRFRDAVFLSFHVDYWDDLGFPDPFSLPKASARQRRYASVWDGGRVYTPQAVVNGRTDFVGSRKSSAIALLNEALKTPGQARLSLHSDRNEGRRHVAYHAEPAVPASYRLDVVLVKPRAHSKVTAGENAGRELSHVNVVRALESVTLTPPARAHYDGQIVMAVDDEAERELFVVGLLHHATTLEIVAAHVEKP